MYVKQTVGEKPLNKLQRSLKMRDLGAKRNI